MSLRLLFISRNNLDLQRFCKCIKTGIENPQSSLGCYAMHPEDYSLFNAYFNPLIRDYHGDFDGTKKHVTSWDTSCDNFDVGKFGLEKLSMRVRVGRNLIGHKLPGSMTKDCRIEFEKKMMPVFEQLVAKYGGKVYSLSPDLGEDESNPNLISEETYKELVDSHVMFKDMSSDSFLKSAGISNDWPYGRGCWQSEDKMRVIWFGEEDQLRIMCMKESTDLVEVFSNLKEMLDTIESINGINFAKHEDYGYITSCPSNLGTGMRASVHLQAPVLTIQSKTDHLLREICVPLNLSVRGTGGEHTPIIDSTVDISPSSRLFVSEGDIISSLYTGVESIVTVEEKVASFLGTQSESSPHDESKVVEAVKVMINASKDVGADDGLVSTEDGNDEKTLHTFNSEEVDESSDGSSRSLVSSERSFILVDNCSFGMEEKDQAEKIKQMKEQIKAMKISTSSSSSRSMSLRSPSSLHLSPSCVMAIKNE